MREIIKQHFNTGLVVATALGLTIGLTSIYRDSIHSAKELADLQAKAKIMDEWSIRQQLQIAEMQGDLVTLKRKMAELERRIGPL